MTPAFPDDVLLAANALLLLWLAWRARSIDWQMLSQPQLTGWLGASTLIAVISQLQTHLPTGPSIHLLGASALTLIAGRDKAYLGFAAICAAQLLNQGESLAGLGLRYLCGPLPAIWLADQLLQLSRRHLPANYFAWFFANGFFGAALSYTVASLFGLGLMAWAASMPLAQLLDEILPFHLLFAWAEAFTSGLVMAALVIYRPQWVEGFDDRHYLRGR